MYKYRDLIEEAIDCVHHIQFKIDLLGDAEVKQDWFSLPVERDMAQVCADLGEVSEEIMLDELYFVFAMLTTAPVNSYMFHHLVFEAGAGAIFARLKEILNSGEFE